MREISRIVLIDDDVIFNFLSTKVIKVAVGITELKVFTRAGDALQYLQTEQPNETTDSSGIIFLDINMPEMNGWGFLDRFSEMPVDIINQFSVYMLSSSNDPGDVRRSQNYPVVKGFISKPLTVQHVLSINS
jgi:CheY-like chemotaxis protein